MAEHEAVTGVSLSNKTYDFLNNIVTLLLPALGVFYASVAAFWGLGYVTEVVGTIAALSVLGGVLIKMSNKTYVAKEEERQLSNLDGTIAIDSSENTISGLSLDRDIIEIQGKKTLTIQVKDVASQ